MPENDRWDLIQRLKVNGAYYNCHSGISIAFIKYH